MIGKHVVIDTLDNFKTKLDQIPSSAIVLIKDVGQIYAHGTYFGAQKTYSLLTKTADGLAPMGGTSASSQISDVNTEWVLTVTNGENPTWRKLPANAFNSSSYTLPSATTSDLGGIKVGQVYTATFDDLVGQYYKINVDKNGLAYVHVPWVSNPYTASGSGITLKDNVFSLSLNSVTKLDSAIGNKIYAVSLDKNGKLCVSVPWVDTNNIFTGATETNNGSSGMVPAPIANQHSYFLRGDGTWVKPNLSDLNDDVVSGKYLPLSGGTLQDGSKREVLTLNTTNNSGPTLLFSVSNTIRSVLGVAPSTNFGAFWSYVEGNIALLLGHDGKPYFSTDIDYFRTKYELLHSNNYSSYALPLSGGTLTGGSGVYTPLTIKNTNLSEVWIKFQDSVGSCYIGSANGIPSIYLEGKGNQTIWHSGNDGSDSGLDADLLDGQNGDWYQKNVIAFSRQNPVAYNQIDANVVTGGMLYNYGSYNYWKNAPTEMYYGHILTLKSSDMVLAGQLAWDVNHNSTTDTTRYLWWRATDAGDWVEAKWHQIAFTDSNIASATKLQTPRTIWGQSFDGTQNVVGSLISDTTKDKYRKTYDVYYQGAEFYASNLSSGEQIGVNFGKAYAAKQLAYIGYKQGSTDDESRLVLGMHSVDDVFNLTALGNVGIGRTNPAHKLDVNGTFNASNNATIGGTLSVTGVTTFGSSINVSGDINLDNHKFIKVKNTSGVLNWLIGLSNDNTLYIGGDTTSRGYNTYLEGANIYFRSSSSRNNNMLINSSGNVLIGTTTSDWGKFHVHGNSVWTGRFTTDKTQIALANPDGAGLAIDSKFSNTGNGLLHIRYNQTYLGSSGTTAFIVKDDGNVGIGTTSPSSKLDVNGSLNATTINQNGKSINDLYYGNHNKFGGFSSHGKNFLWYCVAECTIDNINNETSLTLLATKTYSTYAKCKAILHLEVRNDGTPTIHDWTAFVSSTFDLSSVKLTTKQSGNNIIIKIYCYNSGWSSTEFNALGTGSWGVYDSRWKFYQSQTSTLTSLPSDETDQGSPSRDTLVGKFQREGSSDSYILLGGGGHKALDTLLSVSGGTINGDLYIGDSHNTSWMPIRFRRNGVVTFMGQGPDSFDIGFDNGYLTVGPDKLKYIKSSAQQYDILHSGNIGSQSVNYASSAGNADTLDGSHSTGYFRFAHISALTNKDLNYANNTYGTWNYGDDSTQKNTPTKLYGSYISFGDLASSDSSTSRNQTAQIGIDCWSDLGRMYVRARQAGQRDVTSIGNWRTVAFTTDTVEGAKNWGGYSISVGAAGTNSSTIYFVT